MKKAIILSIFLICLTACGSSPEELAFQTQEAETAIAASWTETPTSTPSTTFTSTPTRTPTLIPTPTLTNTPTPSLTPFADGGQISFWASDKKLFVVNMDGSNLELIFDAVEEGFPKDQSNGGEVALWSPNKKYFTFSIGSGVPGIMPIYFHDLSSKETRLFNEEFWNYLCVWEADESGLICGQLGMFKIPLNSPSEPEPISSVYPCSEGIPRSVGEDNQYLIWVGGYRSKEGLTQLILVDDECSIVHSIYSETFNEKIRIGWSVSQSLNKKVTYLLVDSTTNKNKSTLIEYDFSSETIDLIFELDEYTNDYKVSPDRKLIAMVNSNVTTTPLSITSNGKTFKVMNIESQEILFELDEAYSMGDFCWSPDSQYLFFNSQRLHIASGEIVNFLGITGVPSTSMSNLSCSP